MSPDSAILIDEKVLSEVGRPLPQHVAQLDISMMANLAGRERTEADWKEIAEATDLELRNLVTYDADMMDSVVVLVKPALA